MYVLEMSSRYYFSCKIRKDDECCSPKPSLPGFLLIDSRSTPSLDDEVVGVDRIARKTSVEGVESRHYGFF
jgi:hypothetical protein